MKVSKLIEILQSQPQNMQVLMARDEEGNGYHPISVDVGIYKMVPEDPDNKYNNEYCFSKDGKNFVILWPL